MTIEQSNLPTIHELGETGQAVCHSVIQILDRVGDKWTIMVIGSLAHGPMRFNAIKRAIIGVSHRMLTLTLRNLERDGLVIRRAFPTIPPKVEYELAPLGHSLIDPLWTLVEWAGVHQSEIHAARSEFDAQQSKE
jgi:DNA-binding HxlR family transcriptional regulator